MSCIQSVNETKYDFLEYRTVGASKERACQEVCRELIDRHDASNYIEFVGLGNFINAPNDAMSLKVDGRFKRTDEAAEATDYYDVPQREIKKNMDVSAVDKDGNTLKDDSNEENRFLIRVSKYPFIPENR